MNWILTGNEAGLVAYYQFDNVSGTVLPDRAGFNNGTLTNMEDSDWQESYALLRPGTLPATGVDNYNFTATWIAPSFGGTPSTYFLDVAEDSGYTNMVAGYNNLNVGSVTSYAVNGLVPATDYFYRARAYRSGTTGQSQSTETVWVRTAGYVLNIDIDPVAGGNVVMNPPGGHYLEGTVITLTGSPSAGYAFTGWTGDLATTISPGTIMMDSDKNITAHFTGYTLDITIDPPAGGNVTLDPPGGLYPPGTVVTLTGSPSAGYAFTEWTGDLATPSNPATIMMNTNKTVTAHFTGYTLNATVDPPGSGNVTLNPPGGLYPPGTVVTLTGSPVAGCVFDHWTGDLASSNNPGTIMMNADKNVTALFLNPRVIGLSPADDEMNAARDADLVITFNIPVTAGSGDITIKQSSDDSTVETIAASAAVISGTRVTINPVSNFMGGTGHYVLIDGDAFHDGSANYYVGISDKTVWNFRTCFFTDMGSLGMPDVGVSSVDWGDYDNDGDLDILLIGMDDSSTYHSKVFRNDGNDTFTDSGAALWQLCVGSVEWGDYDNDDDLDILLTGVNSSGRKSAIYRNDGNDVFSNIGAPFVGVTKSSVDWGDYDNDGDLDVLLIGEYWYPNTVDPVTSLYRNNGDGTFTEVTSTGLTNIRNGSVDWGDYDNDGDLDILFTGSYGGGCCTYVPTSNIYRNNGDDTFTDIGAGLTGVLNSSSAWGDYDNDGDLDILLTGYVGSSNRTSRVYRNDGNDIFIDISAGLMGVSYSSAAWGDYDNDGDLDILLTGMTTGGIERMTRIYQNEVSSANTPPSAPAGLWSNLGTDTVTFNWNAATDNETPQDGLTYNLRVGTSVYGLEISSPQSGSTTGYRRVPEKGNTDHNLSWTLNMGGTVSVYPHVLQCRWSVQAVDTALAGSPFAPEQVIGGNQLTVSNPGQMTGDDLLTWEVQYLGEIDHYQVQIDDDPAFGSLEVDDLVDPHLNQVQQADLEGSSFAAGPTYSIALSDFTSSGSLTAGNTYYWQMRPIYSAGYNTVFTWENVPWFAFVGDSFAPVITSCNNTGLEQNWFRPADTVYLRGTGLQPSTAYVLWVQNNPVTEGQALAVISPPENNNNPIDTTLVLTDGNGSFPSTAIWTIPSDSPVTSTQFDIVVDYGSGSGYYNASTDGLDSFTADASLTELLVEIKLDLQGANRPPSGWEVPINVGFFTPDADVMSATPVYSFTGITSPVNPGGGTRAYFACPELILSGTYDITADSTTTLLNVKRNVGIW